MVTVVKRPRWSFWRYEQIYKCDIPRHCAAPLEKAAAFYKLRDAENLILEPGQLRFSRGSVLSSILLPMLSEFRFQHDVALEMIDEGGEKRFRCQYLVFRPFPDFHFPIWRFMNEVNELDAYLGKPRFRPAAENDSAFPRFIRYTGCFTGFIAWLRARNTARCAG